MMVDRKVDFTKPKNLILSALTLISGLSGATIVIGPVQLKGMGLATVVAILASLAFLILKNRLGGTGIKDELFANERKMGASFIENMIEL